jgi:hypothetical protein
VKKGLTKSNEPGPTDVKCKWVVPSNKIDLRATRVNDMEWKQEKYGKPQSSRTAVIARRKLFQPVIPSSKDPTHTNFEKAKQLSAALKKSLPKALLHRQFEPEKTTDDAVHANVLPDTLTAHPSPPSKDLNTEPSTSQFMQNVEMATLIKAYKTTNKFPTLSAQEITLINSATQGQSDNSSWHHLRQTRITASNFHRVFTRINSLQKDDTTNMDSIVHFFLHPTGSLREYQQ